MTHDEYLTQRAALVIEFNDTIMYRANIIDPGKCEDWRSLALGWGLAKDLNPECAVAFATYIFWVVNYGKTEAEKVS